MWEQAPRGRNSPDLKKWRLITSCQSWITHHIHSTLNQPTNRHPSPPNMQAPLSLPLSLPPPSPPRSPPSLPPTYNKVTPIRSPPQPKLKEGKGEEGGTPRRREGGLLDLKMVESWERTREFGDPERSERASLSEFSSLFFPARCFFRVSSGKLLFILGGKEVGWLERPPHSAGPRAPDLLPPYSLFPSVDPPSFPLVALAGIKSFKLKFPSFFPLFNLSKKKLTTTNLPTIFHPPTFLPFSPPPEIQAQGGGKLPQLRSPSSSPLPPGGFEGGSRGGGGVVGVGIARRRRRSLLP